MIVVKVEDSVKELILELLKIEIVYLVEIKLVVFVDFEFVEVLE